MSLDKNNDGKLNASELCEGYKLIYGEFALAEVEKILLRVDADGSGEIDYSGKWLVCLTFRVGGRHHQQRKVPKRRETEGGFRPL